VSLEITSVMHYMNGVLTSVPFASKINAVDIL
jgi:hypothetical protein